MKKETPFYLRHFRHIAVLLFLSLFSFLSIQASVTSDQSDVSSAAVRQEQTSGILRAEKINPTTVDVLFSIPATDDYRLLRRKYFPCLSR